MCRYLYADQVIGNTFIELLKKNISRIKLTDLNEVERNLDRNLREKNNTVVCMSIRDVYATVEKYNTIFEVREDALALRESHKEVNTETIIDLLKDYFLFGLPKDISETVTSSVTASLANV